MYLNAGALPNSVTTILTGGETLPVTVAVNVSDGWGAGPVRLLNQYGPCEMTILCSIFECKGEFDSSRETVQHEAWPYNFSPQRVSIGPLLANTTGFVMDELAQVT